METDNLLILVAVIAVTLSIVGAVVTYNSVSNFRNFVTGFAILNETGTVNVTVSTTNAIEIIYAGGTPGTKNINWGSGIVNVTGGWSFATLSTNGSNAGGTWAAITGPFVVRNIGNVNVTLDIQSTTIASTFIGGTGPLFQYNVSNNETGSCIGINNNTYMSFTASPVQICSVFPFTDSSDEIKIDVLLKIPSDSFTGLRSNSIILTATG